MSPFHCCGFSKRNWKKNYCSWNCVWKNTPQFLEMKTFIEQKIAGVNDLSGNGSKVEELSDHILAQRRKASLTMIYWIICAQWSRPHSSKRWRCEEMLQIDAECSQEDTFSVFQPFLRRMVTRKWLTNDDDFHQLQSRTQQLSQQCFHLKPPYTQVSRGSASSLCADLLPVCQKA